MAANIICNPISVPEPPDLNPLTDVFDGGCCATFASPATAFIQVNASGDASGGHSCATAPSWAWNPGGASSDYEMMIHPVTGSNMALISGPAVDVWHNLGVDRYWEWGFSTTGGRIFRYDVSIRRVGAVAPTPIRVEQEIRLNSECI